MDGDHITPVLLTLMDHRNQQTNGKTQPAISHPEPSTYFYRATKIEKKQTITDERFDLTYCDFIGVLIRLEKTSCHQPMS